MRLNVLLAVTTAALLAVSARAQQPQDCNLSDPASLSRCLKQLLLNARDKVRRESDPLHLPGSNDGEVETRDIVVRGLSAYSVPNLGVTFPQPQQIALSATISWPGLTGDLFVRYRKCKKILWKKRCISVSATPHVTVGSTSGSLTSTLTVNVDSEGRLTVQPSGTSVSLNLPSIHVKANIRSKLGRWVNKILGDPASKIASRVANKWWRKNKPEIEAKARAALDKAVREDVSVHLAQLLPH